MSAWRLVASSILALACASSVAADDVRVEDHRELIERLRAATAEAAAYEMTTEDYDVMVHRDPLAPLLSEEGRQNPKAETQTALSIQGIVWTEGVAMVLIDDQLLRQGDAIGPYTILAIRDEGIDVQRRGKTWFIPREP